MKLGFKLRARDATGTSILIVDCGVDCEELRSSIEEWWWPRILDDGLGLDVELHEQGKMVAPPRPRNRPDLRPFIHCFEMAIGRTPPAGKHDKQGDFNRLSAKIELGSFGLSVLDEKQITDESARVNQIALIRGPRMVVSYMEVGTLLLPCVGAFVAADSVEHALKLSEPASHDKWDPNSARLLNLNEDAGKQVKAILDRLKSQIRRFANEAMPPTSAQEIRLKLLERLLGNMFKPPIRDRVGDGSHKTGPIEIRFVRQPHVLAEDGSLRAAGSFRLALAEDVEMDSARVIVTVECLIVEDEGISLEDPVPTSVSVDGLKTRTDRTTGGIICDLVRESRLLFRFKTKAYPLDWTTQIRVSVREMS